MVLNGFNAAVNASFVGRFFKLEERGSNFTTEFKGAIATFMTLAYILAVNPAIIADSGGICSHDELGFAEEYAACVYDIKRQYVSATAITSMMMCFMMGIVANLPIAMAPGMGLNAYFVYTVVGFHGFGKVSYGTALACVLIEGFIFLFLSVTGIRFFLVRLVPDPVKYATPAGIGAFLAHLGLQTAEGIGVVVGDTATAVSLGGCPPEDRTPLCYETPNGYLCGPTYTCDLKQGQMTSATTWLGIGGLLFMVLLLSYRVNSSVIISMAIITAASWPRGTPITLFPRPSGDNQFRYFQKIVSVEKLNDVMVKYDFGGLNSGDAMSALFTMLYVDFMDCTGTLFALCRSVGIIEKDGNFPRSREAFSVDSIGAIIGSIFGMSPIVAYIESAAGIEIGSRTGLTACFVGLFFFIAIFFAPILSNIPPWATGGALIVVGTLMARSLVHVQWQNPTHAFVAFITVIVMPLTYSIAYGILAGVCGWSILKLIYFFAFKIFKIPDPSVIVYQDVETETSSFYKKEEQSKSLEKPSEAADLKKEDA